MRLTRKAILLSLAVATLLPATAPAPVYIKMEGIKGESTDKDHKDWIDLLSFESVIHRDIATRTAARHGPIRVMKRIDKATPLLMQHLSSGAPLPEVILEGVPDLEIGGLFDGSESGPVAYFQFRMTQATVTSIEHQGGAGDDSLMEERFAFVPERVEWHVAELSPDGKITDRVSTYYDARLNLSGIPPQAPLVDQPATTAIPAGGTATVQMRIQDFDTEPAQVTVNAVSSDPSLVEIAGLDWIDGLATLSLKAMPLRSAEAVITVTADDGEYVRSRSFVVEIEGSENDPFEGFMKAYFNAQELASPLVSSPVADPDGDNLATLMEFIFGTNPREFTPPEEQLQKTVIHAQPGGGGDPVDDLIAIHFLRRIDEPRLRLDIYGSPDGKTWTLLKKGKEPSSNPIYEESASTGQNPLYESVNGVVDPPGATSSYFLHFVGEYN